MSILTRFAIYILTLKGGDIMLVRLFASEVLAERITLEAVPSKLRTRVEAYLREIGYFDVAQGE